MPKLSENLLELHQQKFDFLNNINARWQVVLNDLFHQEELSKVFVFDYLAVLRDLAHSCQIQHLESAYHLLLNLAAQLSVDRHAFPEKYLDRIDDLLARTKRVAEWFDYFANCLHEKMITRHEPSVYGQAGRHLFSKTYRPAGQNFVGEITEVKDPGY